MSLGDVAEHVAAIENDTTPAALDSDQRKRVYVGLYQCHLPRLDDMGVIEFDKSRGYVELGDAARQFDKHLFVDEGRPWYADHAGFVAVAVVVLAAGIVGGLISGAVAGVLLAGLVVGVSGIAAVAVYERRTGPG